MNFNGEIKSFDKEEIEFFYRGNSMKDDLIILSAILKEDIR